MVVSKHAPGYLVPEYENEFSRLIHPRAVLPVKVNQQTISFSTISTVNTFVLLYLITLFIGWIVLMFLGLGLTESLGLSVSSLGNVGPGLGAYGPAFPGVLFLIWQSGYCHL